MSNWLFLMLLYGFFGWMKKRQRDKARDKIESQDDWDTGGIVDFGEGILEAIIGDENSGIEKPKTILKEDIDILMTFSSILISFIVSFFTIKWFLSFVKKVGFLPFIIYRLFLGVSILWLI